MSARGAHIACTIESEFLKMSSRDETYTREQIESFNAALRAHPHPPVPDPVAGAPPGELDEAWLVDEEISGEPMPFAAQAAGLAVAAMEVIKQKLGPEAEKEELETMLKKTAERLTAEIGAQLCVKKAKKLLDLVEQINDPSTQTEKDKGENGDGDFKGCVLNQPAYVALNQCAKTVYEFSELIDCHAAARAIVLNQEEIVTLEAKVRVLEEAVARKEVLCGEAADTVARQKETCKRLRNKMRNLQTLVAEAHVEKKEAVEKVLEKFDEVPLDELHGCPTIYKLIRQMRSDLYKPENKRGRGWEVLVCEAGSMRKPRTKE